MVRTLWRPKKVSRVWLVKKKPTKMTSKKVAKIAKNVALAQHETKFSVTSITYSTLKHDNLYTTQLLTDMNQGTAQNRRIGDTIHLTGIGIKFVGYSIAATSKPCTFRFMVVRCKKDTAPTESQLFLGSSPSTWMIQRHVNTDYCTVLKDQIITLRNAAVNTHPEVHLRKFWIPIKKKHIFDSDDSDLGKYYNYYVCVTPFVENGTQGTTDACYYGLDIKAYFKDA